jgi:LCP family protein required for cell wall assembly
MASDVEGPNHRRRMGSRTPRHAAPRRITPAPPSLSGPTTSTAPPPQIRKPRRRLDRRARLLRTAVIGVAILVVLVGGAFGYLWYRLDQISTTNCPSCSAVVSGQPFNILIIGDDSRADNTPAENAAFGSDTTTSGAHSDTIKIAHIDPATGTASLLSIPRDTYVQLSGLSDSWLNELGTRNQKINAALNDSVDTLVQTVQNSFGIPISSWVLINFNGLINAVNTVGGVNLDFRYPVRDYYDGNNYSGLSIPQAGCQTLNGNETLALSRSRHYEYEVSPGVWQPDPSSDLGRIVRQNVIIEALIDKAKSTYNPFTLNAFIGSAVHDLRIGGLSSSEVLSLAVKYHGFSGSNLQTATVPTYSATSAAGSVEIVDEPQAAEVVNQFLGASSGAIVTPPLDGYGSPITIPTATTSNGGSSSSDQATKGTSSPAAGSTAASAGSQSALPDFDPRPC